MIVMRNATALLASAVLFTLAFVSPARATVYVVHVELDTSVTWGSTIMAFDFNNPDDLVAHQLEISDFDSDGSLDVSASTDPDDCSSPVFPFPSGVFACKDPSGSSVSGTLGNTSVVAISDAGAGIILTYYQRIDLTGATYIDFRFEMTGNPNSGDPSSPDGFTFSLLDPLSQTEFGDLLGPGPLIVYTFDGQCSEEFSGGTATCTPVEIPSVPEPDSVLLAAAALLGLLLARSFATTVPRRGAISA